VGLTSDRQGRRAGRDRKRVSNKGKLKGGTALLTVRDSAQSALTVAYLGNGRLGSDTVAVKSGKKKK
jgi:hypothetical protein